MAESACTLEDRRRSADGVPASLRRDAAALHAQEPTLRPWLERHLLSHADAGQASISLLASKLRLPDIDESALCADLRSAATPAWRRTLARDLAAIGERDPGTRDLATAFLFHKGFQALQSHRLAHALWQAGRHGLAGFLQNRASEVFGVDIHPAARIGDGLFIDHATGIVIGETASVGVDVSMLQGVTLGGTGNEHGNRHPKVGDEVLLCAGATVLGNLRIGRGARIGAGSVVLEDVEPGTTVVGVPARCVRRRPIAEVASGVVSSGMAAGRV